MYEAGQIVYITSIPGVWTEGESFTTTGGRLKSRFVTVAVPEASTFRANVTVTRDNGTEYVNDFTGCTGLSLDELSRKFESLNSTVGDLNADLVRVRGQRDAYRDDLATTQDFLLGEVKEEQSWCDEGTQDVINRLNGLLKVWEYEMPDRWFTVDAEVEGTVSKRIKLRVKASDLDEAKRLVNIASQGELDALIDADDECGIENTDSLLTEAAQNEPFTAISATVSRYC